MQDLSLLKFIYINGTIKDLILNDYYHIISVLQNTYFNMFKES
jgi:hypothetical protein